MKQQQKMQAVTRLFSPAVLALVLLCWGSTALAAIGDPIPAVPIGLEGDPGSIKVNIPGQPLQTIIIGKDGRLNGRVQKPVDKGSNGPAKAMYNGDVSITTDAEATRKNQPASKGVGEPAKAKSGDGNPVLQGIGTTK